MRLMLDMLIGFGLGVVLNKAWHAWRDRPNKPYTLTVNTYGVVREQDIVDSVRAAMKREMTNP